MEYLMNQRQSAVYLPNKYKKFKSMGTATKVVIFAIVFAVTTRLIFKPDVFDASQLRGKRVLITGASSGIGEQLAYQYAKNGANVFITARRENLLQEVVEKCKKIGSESSQFGYITADMKKKPEMEQLVKAAVKELGGLDVVVINHALLLDLKNKENLDEAMETLQTCLTVNAVAPAYIAGLTLPHLLKSGGQLGVVNSAAGKITTKYSRPYASSKFALEAYFTSLTDEMKDSNVSITNIILGAIETAAARTIFDKAVEEINFPMHKLRVMSAVDTAEFIMQGVARGEREIYYPSELNYVVLFRDILFRLGLFYVD